MVTAGKQPWRGFCHQGRIFIACWHGRGTNFIDGRVMVPVAEAIRWAVVQRSRYNVYKLTIHSPNAVWFKRAVVRIRVFTPCIVLENGTNAGKNHDKLITFTIRVRGSFFVFLKSRWRLKQVCAINLNTCKWCSSAGFVYFPQYKTVNCHLQVPLAQTGLL